MYTSNGRSVHHLDLTSPLALPDFGGFSQVVSMAPGSRIFWTPGQVGISVDGTATPVAAVDDLDLATPPLLAACVADPGESLTARFGHPPGPPRVVITNCEVAGAFEARPPVGDYHDLLNVLGENARWGSRRERARGAGHGTTSHAPQYATWARGCGSRSPHSRRFPTRSVCRSAVGPPKDLENVDHCYRRSSDHRAST